MTINLDKRQTIKGLTLGLTALVLEGCAIIGRSSEVIAQRQQLIDRMAKGEFLPNISRLVYDEDGEIGISTQEGYVERGLKDPRIQAYLLELAKHSDKYGRRAEPETVRKALKSPEMLEKVLKYIWSYGNERRLKKADAFVIQYPLDFGLGFKSDAYFLARAFEETTYVKTPSGMVEIPLEERLRYSIRHESAHGDQNADGIVIPDQQKIDSTNFQKIHPEVLGDLKESDAYLRAFEQAQGLEKSHPQYLYAFLMLTKHAMSDEHILVGLNKNQFDTHLRGVLGEKISRLLIQNYDIIGYELSFKK
ncbi:hypothetical protein HYV80_00670 [Candidatus Woesearchaeota archaeon]|nr:hypothetical protein [Candidatus Woesearchaeota archaeon]